MPEDFDPENMEGTRPEGFDPGEFDGQIPDGTTPEGMEMPQMPAEGEMPDFGSFEGLGEAVTYDISGAHISVEIDGGKASGTMEDVVPGSFVTLTVSGKGEVTNVLVSSMSGFGGNFMPGRN